jgi:hypothetical protein
MYSTAGPGVAARAIAANTNTSRLSTPGIAVTVFYPNT